MKTFKYLAICFAVCFLFSSSVYAQCSIAVGIDIVGEFGGFNSDIEADEGAVGETIFYTINVSLTETQCPIEDGVVKLYIPDGAGSPTGIEKTIATGVALTPGTSIQFQETIAEYTIDADDKGKIPSPSIIGGWKSPAPGDVRSYATVVATSVRGEDRSQNAENVVDYDTTVLEPDFGIAKTCLKPAGTLEGSQADFEITVENTGNTALYCKVNDDAAALVDEETGAIAKEIGTWKKTVYLSTDAECTDDKLVENEVSVACYLDEALTDLVDEKATTAKCPVLCPPDFEVEKTCTALEPLTDEMLVAPFNIKITNTGKVELYFKINDAAAGIENKCVGPVDVKNFYEEPVEVPVACINGNVSNTVTVEAFLEEGCTVSAELRKPDTAECPCGGLEGCTPGFWKNHPACWCSAYQPGTLVGDVWAIPEQLKALKGNTLMQALNYKGGKDLYGAAQILLRAAVASLLNACSENVDFPLTVKNVIDGGDAALAGERQEILNLAKTLDDLNNYGCPINAQCEPEDMED